MKGASFPATEAASRGWNPTNKGALGTAAFIAFDCDAPGRCARSPMSGALWPTMEADAGYEALSQTSRAGPFESGTVPTRPAGAPSHVKRQADACGRATRTSSASGSAAPSTAVKLDLERIALASHRRAPRHLPLHCARVAARYPS